MKKAILFVLSFVLASTVFASDTYFVSVTSAKVRSCPSTSCEVLAKLKKGTQIEALETVTGDTVSKLATWYRISINGADGYIHTSLVGSVNPNPPVVANTSSQAAPSVPARNNSGRVPKNCDEARAMGLTAQEAAQYPKLDRDKDGVACYGD